MTVWENNIENNHCQLNLMEQQQFFRSITTESRLFKQALFQDVEKKKKKQIHNWQKTFIVVLVVCKNKNKNQAVISI